MAEVEVANTPTALAPRIAYICTTSEPNMWPEAWGQILRGFVRQDDPAVLPERGRHHFLFGAINACDARILDFFLEYLPPNPNAHFRQVRKTDLEIRMSRARAATFDGRRVRERCAANEMRVVISGEDNDECTEIMLEECDYIIDERTTWYSEWFWKTARLGIPEDNMLTNADYDVSQHDYSKYRLSNRYGGIAWKASSGGFHGNYDWSCRGCGGKCKRGRCKTTSYEPPVYANQRLLPDKGSREWLDMTSNELIHRYRFQMAFGKHVVQEELRTSVDTFSGD